jgi:hypothetical protein
VKRSGRPGRVKVSASGRGVVSHAGTALWRELATETGLAGAVTGALAGAYRGTPVHAPGQVFADLAVAIADGADAVAGIGVLRDREALFGPVASAPTAWRLLDRIGRAWGGCGRRGPRPGNGPGRRGRPRRAARSCGSISTPRSASPTARSRTQPPPGRRRSGSPPQRPRRTREGNRGTTLTPARPARTPNTGSSDKPLPGLRPAYEPRQRSRRPYRRRSRRRRKPGEPLDNDNKEDSICAAARVIWLASNGCLNECSVASTATSMPSR